MRSDTDLEVADPLMGGRWFASLPPELRLAIVAASTVRTFEPGEALIRQGELPRGLCGVLEGRAQIARVLENGREVLLHVGGPGMWFGDWSVISGRPALYTTSAVTRCRALVLPLAAFRRLVDEQPRWYEEFNRYLLANMESFYVAFAAQVGLTAEGWFRYRLALFAATVRRNESVTGPVTLHVSQAELARSAGLSRQALSGMLRRLQQRGLIEIGFRRIVVRDEDALRRAAQEDGMEALAARDA